MCVCVCVCVCARARAHWGEMISQIHTLGPCPCWGMASVNHRMAAQQGPAGPLLPRDCHALPGRTWGTRSGQEVNEEDGQTDVQQDHHADEDGVGDLGTAETGCLSPQERTLPDPTLRSVLHLDRPSELEGFLEEIINQTAQGPERVKNVSQGTQQAELVLESKSMAVPTASSSGAASLSPSGPSSSLWHCSFLLP